MNCENGKCGLKDQTSDKVITFMTTHPENKNGFALFVFRDANEDRNLRKNLLKDTTYVAATSKANLLGEDFISFKFIPYGFDETLDYDVKNDITGLKTLSH